MQTLASGEVEGKGEESKISRFPKCTFNPLLACFECVVESKSLFPHMPLLSSCLAFCDTCWIQIKSKLCDSSNLLFHICI